MKHIILAGLIFSCASAAIAADPAADPEDQFIDDRSSPERVVTSLYNAIDRHEYLRAWSYFAAETAPAYVEFRDGYAETESVELRLGEAQTEGAAGSVHTALPVVIRATATDGKAKVYAGCYLLTQVSPAIQDMPPFRPIEIDSGTLETTDDSFDAARGSCEEAF